MFKHSLVVHRAPRAGRETAPPAPRRNLAGLHYRLRRGLQSGQACAAEVILHAPDYREMRIDDLRPRTRPEADAPLARRLRLACADAARWTAGTVSIGCNGASSETLPGLVATVLEETGLDPERLELLFAERVLAQAEQDLDLVLALSAIRDLGVGVALDEFGAELGNLAHLRRLPLSGLKLARSMVRALPGDREDAALVKAVILAARALSLTVVADGIESQSQVAFLSGCGCDDGQGNIFGPPLGAAAMGGAMV